MGIFGLAHFSLVFVHDEFVRELVESVAQVVDSCRIFLQKKLKFTAFKILRMFLQKRVKKIRFVMSFCLI